MQAELGHEEAVDHAHQGADGQSGQDGHCNPAGGSLGQAGEHSVDIVGLLQEHGSHSCSQALDTAGGQVGTGQNDTAGDTQSHGQVRCHLGDQVSKRAPGKELLLLGSGVDNENQHQDIQGIVQDAVCHTAALILGAEGFEFIRSSAEIGYGICHKCNPPYTYLAARVIISSWLVLAVSTSPATRPPDITTIRSQTPSSSGISEETMITVLPARARSRISW